MGGSTYISRVYNSNIYSESTLDVVNVSWNFPTVGSGVSSSGHTTSRICRYKVLDVDACVNYGSGIISCEMFSMTSDQNLDGSYDCSGFDHGDSGGAPVRVPLEVALPPMASSLECHQIHVMVTRSTMGPRCMV